MGFSDWLFIGGAALSIKKWMEGPKPPVLLIKIKRGDKHDTHSNMR
ncbi:MAG: hypothetical protein PHD70_07720 [Anaerostipes sp.]|nr:hypothetical protein [Anaerostipes sp.]